MNLRATVQGLLPAALRNLLQARRALKPLYARECPLCGYQGMFSWYGRPPRVDAMCPRCHSMERHRQLWLWLQRQPRLLEPVLHFAAEPVLERKLRADYPSYPPRT